MNLLERKLKRNPLGIWITLLALLLIMLAWLMQGYSLLNWEKAVELGLQNSSFLGNDIELAWATKERGEALADLLWPFPLTLIAIIGLWKRKIVGFVASMMVFAICIYFPLFYVFQVWDIHRETAVMAVIIWGIPSILGIIGLWANKSIFLKTSPK